jgi:hypothetical protein
LSDSSGRNPRQGKGSTLEGSYANPHTKENPDITAGSDDVEHFEEHEQHQDEDGDEDAEGAVHVTISVILGCA